MRAQLKKIMKKSPKSDRRMKCIEGAEKKFTINSVWMEERQQEGLKTKELSVMTMKKKNEAFCGFVGKKEMVELYCNLQFEAKRF